MHNLVILAGNVGATPEARTTQGGTRITHFSLATSRPKRDSNGKMGAPNLNYLRATELVDTFGFVMSDRARLENWTMGQIDKSGGGILAGSSVLTATLRVTFKLLG